MRRKVFTLSQFHSSTGLALDAFVYPESILNEVSKGTDSNEFIDDSTKLFGGNTLVGLALPEPRRSRTKFITGSINVDRRWLPGSEFSDSKKYAIRFYSTNSDCFFDLLTQTYSSPRNEVWLTER